ncbi:MAG: ornithine carbamoyltransferase [Thermodesulfovibrionales bacterium]|nr:ornithine carbamoyltransferase [Thermodesulfovibrionales bacterium]
MKRDFLTLWDLSSDEIEAVLKRAIALKAGKDASKCPLIGKSIGLLFEKASTRTKVSFEVGIHQLGGQPVYMTSQEIQLGRGETVADTAKTLSRYLSAVIIRTFEQEKIEEFAFHSSVPVINALTDLHHPCQGLSDLMTILEKKGRLKGIKLAYIGDGNNVANSLIEASSRMQINLTIACPEGLEPNPDVLERARENAKSEIIILRETKEAAGMADVIYTDVWVSMGQEEMTEGKKRKLAKYQLNNALLSCAKEDAVVMHCLPAKRGQEITDEVMDSPRSIVFDQAENRLHSQKALLEFLLVSRP